MSDSYSLSAKCRWCGYELDPKFSGSCPKCGKVGKDYDARFSTRVVTKTSVTWQKTKEFYRKNKILGYVILMITIASAFLGLFLGRVTAVAVGLILGLLTYYLTPKAVLKIREIERGSSNP